MFLLSYISITPTSPRSFKPPLHQSRSYLLPDAEQYDNIILGGGSVVALCGSMWLYVALCGFLRLRCGSLWLRDGSFWLRCGFVMEASNFTTTTNMPPHHITPRHSTTPLPLSLPCHYNHTFITSPPHSHHHHTITKPHHTITTIIILSPSPSLQVV